MTSALHHRGPDGERYLVEPGLGLGHSRLSIIDLPTGWQPMSDADQVVSVVFNGEIYNYREIRAELETKGRTFRTQSDTEAIIQGFLEFGIDVLDKLVGMFAFALWDRRSADLYLVRDRLGVKPLYWTELEGQTGIAFASELTALRRAGCVPGGLNRTALGNFVALSYIPGAESAFDGVNRLEPATYLRWRRAHGLSKRRYWDLASIWTNAPPITKSEPDIAEEFLARLEAAVRRRLISDVPLGALLSGGIDSTTVCALIMRNRKRLVTSSVGFVEATYDELPYARIAARHLGTEHYDEVVSCESPDLLLEVASHIDEPFADTSILPTYALCRSARRHVTVALSGDGGDELLAGYSTHAADALHGWFHNIPGPLMRVATRLAGLIPDPRSKVGAVFKLKQFLRGAELDPAQAHASWRMLAMTDNLKSLFQPGFWSDRTDPFAPALSAFAEVPDLTPLDRNLYVDYKTWLPDDILTKVDRASMAHALEVRGPFLDHQLVEYCAGLPARMKRRGMHGKHVLLRAARGLVPPQILSRSKRGFNSPVSHWIAGPWRELACDTLDEHALQREGILNGRAVQLLLKQHLAGRHDHGFLLFALLVLSLWTRSHRT
jgi:asparagine synthase (glutamine-hydrolysing)